MVEGFTYVHEHGPDNYPGPPTTPSQLSRKAHGGRAARWQHSRTIIMHGPDYLIAHSASSREGWGLERAMKGIVRRGSWKGLKGLRKCARAGIVGWKGSKGGRWIHLSPVSPVTSPRLHPRAARPPPFVLGHAAPGQSPELTIRGI